MKKTMILFLIAFLSFSINLKSQNLQIPDTTKNNKNAGYLNGDIAKLLQKNTLYPTDALANEIEGNVVISFVILKEGKMDKLKVLSSPDETLSSSSIASFRNIENEWSPCINNGIPTDKEYCIVFKYRMYIYKQPSNVNEEIESLIKKQKYEKALKYINKEIKENPYDYKLFDARSKINELLGNKDSAKKDAEQSIKLQNEVIAIVDVNAIGTFEKRSVIRSVTWTETKIIQSNSQVR